MSKCKCGARIAKLERQVDRLTANLPKEIHHAVRTELRVARTETSNPASVTCSGLDSLRCLGSSNYSDGS